MTPTDADDEALRWDGDEPSRAAAPAAPAPAPATSPVLPDGFEAVGKGVGSVGRLHADGTVTMPGERPPLSNALLVTLGVIAGIHALYAVGWAVAGLRLVPISAYLVATDGVAPPLWQGASVGALVLAVAAPVAWFAAGLVLTRAAKPWVRVAVLLSGVVLLAPWPLFSVPAVGA